MKSWLAAISCVLFIWPLDNVLAQAPLVQSGEHDSFTRLVIPIGTERDWARSDQANTIAVRFSPDLQGLDLSSIFQTAPRERISDVSFSNSELVLSLACPCEVDLFRYSDRFLVIDVSDPPPQTDTPSMALPVTFERSPPRSVFEFPLPRQETEPDPFSESTARILSEQIARAASAGLLDASLDSSMNFADPTSQRMSGQNISGAGASDYEDDLPITVSNGHSPMRLSDPPGIRGLGGCPAEEDFSFLTYEESLEFHSEYAALQANLFDDRDQLNEMVALELARLYLAHGLGTEAAYWLNATSAPSDSLLALATYFDGTSNPAFPSVIDHNACNGMPMLWRAIATDAITSLSDDQASAMLQAFLSLENRMQALIGADLARAFSEFGHDHVAQDVLDRLESSPHFSPSEETLLAFDLALDTDPQIAGRLQQIPQDHSSLSIDALARLLMFARSQNEPVSNDLLISAEALIREASLGPQDSLWHETVIVQARSGDIGVAAAMITSQFDATTPDLPNTIDQMFSDLAKNALVGRALFLERALAEMFPIEGLSREAKIDLALLYRDGNLPDEYLRIRETISGRLPEIMRPETSNLTMPETEDARPDPDMFDMSSLEFTLDGEASITGMMEAIEESRSLRASIAEMLVDTQVSQGN